jgi:hypothetical protein
MINVMTCFVLVTFFLLIIILCVITLIRQSATRFSKVKKKGVLFDRVELMKMKSMAMLADFTKPENMKGGYLCF